MKCGKTQVIKLQLVLVQNLIAMRPGPINQQRRAKQKQSLIIHNTQLKIYFKYESVYMCGAVS